MLFSVNNGKTSWMNPADRLEWLILQAVAARRFSSHSDFLKQAGFQSRGQLKSWRARLEKNPGAKIGNISAMARLLGMTVERFEAEVFGADPSSSDRYPSRADAVDAARKLQLPEAAIQAVLSEDPGTDPGRWYWFKRIEAESARLAPFVGVLS
jgi:Arc/MetJ-type ribon-helix-helix transcriptional regulator